jgi:hypothetical protein
VGNFGSELVVSIRLDSMSPVGGFRHGESGFGMAIENGALCGRGDMSMHPLAKAGEEEGMGGVVKPSR